MTYLGIAAFDGTATAVEVGDFTLLLCGNELCVEWQADSLPTLGEVNVEVRHALIPHTLTISELIADRTVEVLLIYQQMILCSRIGGTVPDDLITVDAIGDG